MGSAKKVLVIVESPSKAKTIGKFLGSNYKVIASVGHVRDLPKSKLGVDIDNNFEEVCDKIRAAIGAYPPPSADGTPFCERGLGESTCQMLPENGVRYIVPQKINPANLKSGGKFFFRVDNIYRNCKIILKSDEEIIYSKKKIKVMPSEMESITIDAQILDRINNIKNLKNLVICLEK